MEEEPEKLEDKSDSEPNEPNEPNDNTEPNNEPNNEPDSNEPEKRKRGRPRMTPEQKKEAKASRLKVVAKEKPEPKIIERVVREYVEVPVPVKHQTPLEVFGNVLRSQAVNDYERKRQQWASFKLI